MSREISGLPKWAGKPFNVGLQKCRIYWFRVMLVSVGMLGGALLLNPGSLTTDAGYGVQGTIAINFDENWVNEELSSQGLNPDFKAGKIIAINFDENWQKVDLNSEFTADLAPEISEGD